MHVRKTIYGITILSLSIVGYSCAQTENYQLVGRCEGCEAIFEFGKKHLNAVDTLPGFLEAETKLKITGVIYKPDGITPAEGVILYVYQTNAEGVYPTHGDEKNWSRRHGYIRGWTKTDHAGRYTLYTLKPGTYPSRTDAAHIHPVILEPNGKYYWVDEYLFDDDPLLTSGQLSAEAPAGGTSGVMKLRREGKLWVGERDLILGKNVKGYSEE
jgi:protocatechuate 3,4-dioxygenase, beta subunit